MTHRKPFAVVTDQGQVVGLDVLDRYASKSESRQLEAGDVFAGIDIGAQLIEPKYNPEALARSLELNTWHARASRVKAQDVAGEGWRLVPTKAEADEDERALLSEFFSHLPVPPSGDLHGTQVNNVFERAQLDFESTGYATIELVRVDYATTGPLRTIAHIPSHTVRKLKDNRRFVQIRGGKRRWYKMPEGDYDVDAYTGEVKKLGEIPARRRATEILFWSNYWPGHETYGAPDHLPALGAIYGDLGRRDYNLAFFRNFGVPAYLVTITGDFDPGDTVNDKGEPDPEGKLTELEYVIQQHVKDLRLNPHSNLVLSIPTREGDEKGQVKVDFKPLATEVKEASFRLYRKDNATEVLASHGVPAARVGAFEAGAANREASDVYKRSVIDARQRTVEELVNLYVVRGAFGVTDWRWDLTDLDNRDESHELDLLTKLHAVGAVHEEEIRSIYAERFGLDRDRGAPGPPAGRPGEHVEKALAGLAANVDRAIKAAET